MRLMIALSTAATLAAAAVVNNKRAAIDDCLRDAGVPTSTPGTSDWTIDTHAFNQRLKYTPAAIAAPTTIEHVRRAVECAARVSDVKVSAKCGGHSYASFGLGGEDGHLVVQLDRMDAVELDKATGIATVEAGARLGHVATVLVKEGRDFSHGTCPGVGVSGHTLHGGFGFSSHTHGLALDWAVGATVVLANGTIVEASATQNPSLFWALRGAGSNFGIVVTWRFRTFPVPETVTSFEVNLPAWRTNATALVKGFSELQDWLLSGGMPKEMNMRLLGNGFQMQLQGLYHGNAAGMRAALAPLLPRLGTGINATGVREYDWMGGFKHYSYSNEIDVRRPHRQAETFYAKSLVTGALPEKVLERVAEYWVTKPRSLGMGRSWYILIDMYGGPNSAITQVPKDETSYAYRDPKKHLFLYQFNDGIFFGQYPANGFEFLDGWVRTFTEGLGQDWGMYINYADPRLGRSEAQEVYYRESLPRLRQLKKQFDPNELFYYPQAIQPAA
ncbi:hypothetical protein VTJ83DRAFT_2847 [Remersonia thermophila]|uniref:FAD-binding PCMH-type domain-containing protein n=1 Tax=Remersonia thermophila TaxID=72144 RepID=A0ABR4DCD0_9PEZI